MNQKTTALIIVGIAAIMLFTINCSGSSPSDTPPTPEPEVCECPDKEHLGIGETCCDLEDCTCTLKVYGEIDDNTYGNHFKIYRNGDVTDAEMAVAVANITAAYEALADGTKIDLPGKIDEMHITPVSEATYTYTTVNGKKVLTSRHNRPETSFGNLFSNIANGFITLAHLQQNDAIRLANEHAKVLPKMSGVV